MHKILIADDHELFRDGLRLMVQEVFPGFEFLGTGDFYATDEALQKNPDVALVLLDIQMPGSTGLEGLEKIKCQYPALPVVVISTVDHRASIQQMLALGADGFIAKTSSRKTMIQALQRIMTGEVIIISEHENADALILTPRQIDTLELMAEGLANKDIAEQLNISSSTVREYVSDILKVFACDNRTQAVLKARRLGFILD